VPDLNYQTHLSDYIAVRRGIAKAELDRIKDGLARVDALVLAENKAAESLSNLKIPQAKAQAWDIFQETWSRNFAGIQGFLTKPSRYSGKLLRESQSLLDSLKKLHDKHHELVAAVVTRASRQLAPGVVTTARVFADAQAISNEISAQTKDLNKKIEERQKLFSNPLFQITEEP
jgi:tryptophan 2,3-dioxygenase